MKLLSNCMKCIFEHEDLSQAKFVPVYAEMNSDGFYELECPHGHKTIVWVQNEQFELLFDSAVLALLDGYSREAVSSFAASLERFHEFFIRVIYHQTENNNDEFEKAWKHMSNQSERQLGAFYMAYLNEFKKSPPFIPEKLVKFRNGVIHKGNFPSANKAEEYGEYIYNYIIEMLIELRKQCPDGFLKPSLYRMGARVQKDYSPFATATLGTSIRIMATKLGENNFQEVLNRMKKSYGSQYSK